MRAAASHTLRIAAALIDDDRGRLLLVRKAGTPWFMQAGGKIEGDETALAALRRELREELGLMLDEGDVRHIGRYAAPAANEPDHAVDAEIFHVRLSHTPAVGSEIVEAVWVSRSAADLLPLAPLTRDHVLALSHRLGISRR